jgi:hypothetical protein
LSELELNVFDKGPCPAPTYIAKFDHASNAERSTVSFGDCDREASSGSNRANV